MGVQIVHCRDDFLNIRNNLIHRVSDSLRPIPTGPPSGCFSSPYMAANMKTSRDPLRFPVKTVRFSRLRRQGDSDFPTSDTRPYRPTNGWVPAPGRMHPAHPTRTVRSPPAAHTNPIRRHFIGASFLGKERDHARLRFWVL
jgi:hypothetical protein